MEHVPLVMASVPVDRKRRETKTTLLTVQMVFRRKRKFSYHFLHDLNKHICTSPRDMVTWERNPLLMLPAKFWKN